jgi:hypothetical protein
MRMKNSGWMLKMGKMNLKRARSNKKSLKKNRKRKNSLRKKSKITMEMFTSPWSWAVSTTDAGAKRSARNARNFLIAGSVMMIRSI